MTSILRLRLVEAALLIEEEYPHAVEMKIQPTMIRIIATSGFYTAHRLISWEVVDNAIGDNPLTTAIEQAVRQLQKTRGLPYDTSMGL